MGEGEDVVRCAEKANHGRDKGGDEEAVKVELLLGDVAVGVLADEGERSHKMDHTTHLHSRS